MMGTAAYLTWAPPHVLASTEEVASAAPDSANAGSETMAEAAPADTTPDLITAPLQAADQEAPAEPVPTEPAPAPTAKQVASTRLPDADIESMIRNHPYRNEAVKVLSGRLTVADSLRRRSILTYCEHFRCAYDTKDLDFLRQIFSDNALIIVGHTVRSAPSSASSVGANEKVKYSIRSKQEYLDRLAKIFASNQKIRVNFSDFHILRHPTVDGIYGVSLRQKYSSGSYADDGYLFLLWDFRDESKPKIHVRTWQPQRALAQGEELIEISDFNLE